MEQSQQPGAGKIAIMNGSCTIDRMNDHGSWETRKVLSAPGMPQGIHYMNQVKKADPNENASYEGPVAFVGKNNVFAFNNGELMKHDRKAMSGIPKEGSVCRIEYDSGRSRIEETHKQGSDTSNNTLKANRPRP